MYRTDDPVADYERYDADREAELAKLPKCDCCGEPIVEEHFYNIDGTFICEECMRNQYRVCTDNYIDY